jgi:hypothetical protein
MAIALKKEVYYLKLYNYHHCNNKLVKNEFSYQNLAWTNSSCDKPTQNFKFAHSFNSRDYLIAARRKNNHVVNPQNQTFSQAYYKAFQDSANFYLNKVIEEDNNNAYTIFIRSEFRSNEQMRIKNIQKPHFLAPNQKEIIDTLDAINKRYRDECFKAIEVGDINSLHRIESYELIESLNN